MEHREQGETDLSNTRVTKGGQLSYRGILVEGIYTRKVEGLDGEPKTKLVWMLEPPSKDLLTHLTGRLGL
jgi:hypothetical protein